MARIRTDVMRLAEDWRQVLAEDPNNARPIVSALLIGRVTIKRDGLPTWRARCRAHSMGA